MRTPVIPSPSGAKPQTQAVALNGLSTDGLEMVEPPRPSNQSPIIGDATEKGDPSKNDADPTVPTIYAQVLDRGDGKDYIVNDGQMRARLKPGKIISSLQYNLKDLARQGVKMKKVEKAQVDDPFDTSFLQ